jgi:hypothetical protein
MGDKGKSEWRNRLYWTIGCIVVGFSLFFADRHVAPGFLSKAEKAVTEFFAERTEGSSGSSVIAPPTRPARTFVSGSMVSDYGTVIRILDDDNQGSRHQRFILQLSTGQTLLIAHNIDVAPRINNLSIGDSVSFFGQYEANAKGGVIHWTHRDPKGVHTPGFLNHKGQMYQ